MQLLLPAAYTAIALGFVDSVLRWCPRAVQVPISAAPFSPTSPTVCPPQPSLALRSSISSEGSLLFVVCPSRISTHSVSGETRGALSPYPPSPVPASRPPRVRARPSLLLSVAPSFPPRGSPSLARATSVPRERGRQNGAVVPAGEPSSRPPPDQNGDGVARARETGPPCAILRNPPWHRTPRTSLISADPFACSQTPLQMQSRVQTMTSRTASFI